MFVICLTMDEEMKEKKVMKEMQKTQVKQLIILMQETEGICPLCITQSGRQEKMWCLSGVAAGNQWKSPSVSNPKATCAAHKKTMFFGGGACKKP